MTDLTPIFNQCVAIITQELTPVEHKVDKQPYIIEDTFTKESGDLYGAITKINSFLTDIKPKYLSINYDEPGKLTIEDKDALDKDIQREISVLYEKYKVIKNYEIERGKVSHGKKSWISNVFGDDEEDAKDIYFNQLKVWRSQILGFIGKSLDNTSKVFEDIVRKRHHREQQLNLLNFQNLEDNNDNFDSELITSNVDYQDFEENSDLSQVQLQELKTENEDYLNMKNQQLKQVEQLHSSMVDIINIQQEINYQISQQSDQISNLIDNQDQINLDLREGNKNLSKATTRNKKSANMIIMTSILLGCLILFMDFVN
ncbi:syntaxin Ufe1p [[Candida] jaroonii]|uniref:Syntaxin Ufe1p n=1 Tax=[Candida] jaroonii TaxID=467808 RepID=A0ACA9Y357_9ASCO|nr:syntaxin Ufe1p [[Candida] jaroonii]